MVLLAATGMTHEEINTKRLPYKRNRIKQIVQYCLYESGATYQKIGDMIGLSSHETVLRNVGVIRGLIEPGKAQDKELKIQIDKIMQYANSI